MAILPPPVANPCYSTSAYDRFMQEPYRAANRLSPLLSDGSHYGEWLSCLKVEVDELKGLIAQAACHAPPTLDQLVTAAILAKNEDKPSSTFVGQVILNASSKAEDFAMNSSSFVYRMADSTQVSSSPTTATPSRSMVCRPPDHLVKKFGEACFHCGRQGHWQADCHQTKGFANPNPRLRLPSPFTPARVRVAEP
ncbi:hypothetical protein O181_067472 [Austropuccinia psidii MF-1]|uniref:CCHC-type domain-containing protein n=1 Tax=Austropuccinia psidii MF-1 TaxID=1389203 RepID=A0A9Q3I5B1_9BASI|nr:hypothetical protein [Austropuccinia psidii MF-1]